MTRSQSGTLVTLCLLACFLIAAVCFIGGTQP